MESPTVIDSDKAVAEGIPGKINSAVAASIANGATAEQLRPVSDLGVNLKARADAVALDAARHHKASPLLAGVETSVSMETTVDRGINTLVHGIAGRINTAVVQSRALGASAIELQPIADLVYAMEADAPVLAGAVEINTPNAPAHSGDAVKTEAQGRGEAEKIAAKQAEDPRHGWTPEQHAALNKTPAPTRGLNHPADETPRRTPVK